MKIHLRVSRRAGEIIKKKTTVNAMTMRQGQCDAQHMCITMWRHAIYRQTVEYY